MVTTESGIVIDFTNLHPLNAPSQMDVTAFRMSILQILTVAVDELGDFFVKQHSINESKFWFSETSIALCFCIW